MGVDCLKLCRYYFHATRNSLIQFATCRHCLNATLLLLICQYFFWYWKSSTCFNRYYYFFCQAFERVKRMIYSGCKPIELHFFMLFVCVCVCTCVCVCVCVCVSGCVWGTRNRISCIWFARRCATVKTYSSPSYVSTKPKTNETRKAQSTYLSLEFNYSYVRLFTRLNGRISPVAD